MAGNPKITKAGKATQFPHNDPTKGGRPSNISRLEKLLGVKFPAEWKLRQVQELLSRLMFMTVSELQALAKDKNSPILIVTIAASLVKNINSGKMDAVKDLMDRVFGRPTQVNELSGPGGGPISIQAPKIDRTINIIPHDAGD